MKINILNKFFSDTADKVPPNTSTDSSKEKIQQYTECPNCKFKIQKEIKSKTQCPQCKKAIYVRTHYKTKQRIYLSEEEKKKYEDEKEQYYFSKKWIEQLKIEGITEEQIKKKRDELREKWGPGHPSFNDLVWALFNEQVINLAKKKADYSEFSSLYRTWAFFAGEIDTDSYNLKKESLKFTLLGYKDSEVITGVDILANKCCESCEKDNGKILTIDEALSEEGILPHKNCTYKLFEDSKHSWCRCVYLGRTEFSSMTV